MMAKSKYILLYEHNIINKDIPGTITTEFLGIFDDAFSAAKYIKREQGRDGVRWYPFAPELYEVIYPHCTDVEFGMFHNLTYNGTRLGVYYIFKVA